MSIFIRRAAFAGIALVCLSSVACFLPLPYCAPQLSVISSVKPDCEIKEVSAFRVDITSVDQLCSGKFGGLFPVEANCYELTRLPFTSQGTLPEQSRLGFLHGNYYLSVLPPFAGSFAASTRHTIAVRLYRSGFETVVIGPWETADKVMWRPALDLVAEEKAVDDLLGIRLSSWNGVTYMWYSSFDEIPRGWPMGSETVLEPGSRSAAHREALLFAAAEYERLAHEVVSPTAERQKVCERMREKASRLRLLAEGKSGK
jgi:hypothetical protein